MRKKFKLERVAGALTLVVLAGCSTVTSRTEAPASARAIGDADGITYFLPRQLATITAKRTESRLSKAVGNVAKAQTAVTDAEAAVAKAEVAVGQARAALVASPDNDTSRRILTEQLTERQVELRSAQSDLEAQRKKLATATDTLKTEVAAPAASAKGAYDVSLTISLLEPSADPNHMYRLSPRHSVLRDDEHKLTISPTGLLATTNVVAADRTGDILVEIATFAGAIAGPGLTGTPPRDGREKGQEKKCTDEAPNEFSGVVDFANAFDVAAMNDDLQCLGVRIKTEGKMWPASSRPQLDKTRSLEGIVYRTPVELMVRIEKCTLKTGDCTATKGWYPTQVLALALPQAGPISVVRQDAGLMAKTRYTLTFDDGMLTSYDASRPSEILEVARTPMRIVQAGFDGISKVVSLRTGQANNLASLATAQLALADARAAQARGSIRNQRLLSEEELLLARALVAQQAGAIDGRRTISESELALYRALIAQQAGVFEGQRSLSAAEMAALEAALRLQSAGVTGQTQLTNDQLAWLNAQTNYAIAQGNVPVQLSTAQFNAMAALARIQGRRDEMTRCLEQLRASSPTPSATSIEACVAVP